MSESHRPQGYPKCRDAEEDKKSVSDRSEGTGYADLATFIATLPAIGDAFTFVTGYSTCTLKSRIAEYRDDTNIFVATLEYDNEPLQRQDPDEESEEVFSKTFYSLDNSGVTKPITEAFGEDTNVSGTVTTPMTYKYAWDHGLATSHFLSAAFETEDDAAIAEFNKLALVEDDPDFKLYGDNAFTASYRPFQQLSEIPRDAYVDGQSTGNWRIIAAPLKPGVTDFLVSAPRITMRVQYKLPSTGIGVASTWADQVGKKAAGAYEPDENFGLLKEWLITSVTFEESDVPYGSVLSVTWTGADTVDTDLYFETT